MTEEVQAPSSVYDELLDSKILQTQDDVILERFRQRIKPYFIVTGFLFAFLLLEIFRWMTNAPPLPIVVGGLFIISMSFVLFQIKDCKDDLKFVRLGKHGEPDVIDVLNEIGNDSEQTIHKAVNINGREVDYILVDQAGVILIRVCNWRTPTNSAAIIEYDDDEMLLNGYRPDENPIANLKGLRKFIENQLYVGLGKPISIENIVVFPEWFVKTPVERVSTSVINPRELNAMLRKREGVLSDNDTCLLNYHVSKLVKNTNKALA